MPRIRTIKPDFFISEDIGELTVSSRLLYIALWTQADKEGKLKFNKVYLKAVCMPYEQELFMDCIEELKQKKHIIIYEIDGKLYLKLPTFTKHQKCHHTEAESSLPDPIFEAKNGHNSELTVKEPLDNRKEQEKEREQEREEQHPPTPQKGDACFFENVLKEKTQDIENKNIILERWIDLKIQTGKNIMNVGGYKARLSKALSDGTASLPEMQLEIEKMQNELENKKRKQQEMELILQSNEQTNQQKISNDAIMIFYHSLPTQEKEKIQNEVEKKAIKENPRFEYFPPTIQKMTRTAHLIDICMPMLMEATKCAN